MVTLNSIAENIAYKLGEQFNHTLKESIKNRVVAFRELLIRRDLQRNNLDYNTYLQTIYLELELVTLTQCGNCFVSETKQKVPRPLRMSNNGAVNLKYVGFADFSKSFTFSTTQAIKYMSDLPLQDNAIYYDYINDKIRVFNLQRACKIAIQIIPSDPRDIDDCNNPDIFKDDIEFPLSNDLVGEISRLVEDEYRQEPSNGKEINIDKND